MAVDLNVRCRRLPHAAVAVLHRVQTVGVRVADDDASDAVHQDAVADAELRARTRPLGGGIVGRGRQGPGVHAADGMAEGRLRQRVRRQAVFEEGQIVPALLVGARANDARSAVDDDLVAHLEVRRARDVRAGGGPQLVGLQSGRRVGVRVRDTVFVQLGVVIPNSAEAAVEEHGVAFLEVRHDVLDLLELEVAREMTIVIELDVKGPPMGPGEVGDGAVLAES
mmetsp:Transcript_86680/g.280043  ORF Transcript_86680/g.280043 Transcript_86680/m.280043 type:complete len:224 (+) Transcript_86680:643-1314(+)